jgi:tRNA (guanine26-N2/guanine27-N2)-dimethyltransferase
MLRLVSGQQLTEANYGFLAYCHHCGEYETVTWRQLGRISPCPRDGQSRVLSGPLWLGALHDRQYLHRMQISAQQQGWPSRVKLLQTMIAEADLPPYFYGLGEIGRRSGRDMLPREQLLARLRARGYRSSATHITPQAVKTEADLATCVAIAREQGIGNRE